MGEDMRRDVAEKINALAMDCARRLAASVIVAQAGRDDGIYFHYMFRASDIADRMFVTILNPIWMEHVDLAPRWYREDAERRARCDRPRITPDMREELLALMDELQQEVTTTVDIAAGNTDDQALARFGEAVNEAVEEIARTSEIVSAMQVRDDSDPLRLARRDTHEDPDALLESWLRRRARKMEQRSGK